MKRCNKATKVLICEAGRIIDIKTGKKKMMRVDVDMPPDAVTFQINAKLHVCGGSREICGLLD